MPGVKTNERPGTRAVLRHSHMSAFKAREVLDLIRGVDYVRAAEILESAERGAAEPIGKLLRSAAANAENNDELDPEELYVSACYADEGTTLKRWRPRARGRATRIRKRTCHVTIILSRMSDEEIARRRARQAAEQAERRQRRVAGTRRARRQRADTEAELAVEQAIVDAQAAAEAEAAEAEAREAVETEVEGGEEGTSAGESTAEDTGAEEPAEQEGTVTEDEDAVGEDATGEPTPDEERK